jgi:ribosomal protein S18 acetylase RimI-like enzyme
VPHQANLPPTCRPAVTSDQDALEALVGTARFKHEHLDWVHALDLLGASPFILAFSGTNLVGCLACPPDRPHVAWLKLFACASGVPLGQVWGRLWETSREALREQGVRVAAALPVSEWLRPLLENSGFRKDGEVVFLEHYGPPSSLDPTPPVTLRNMEDRDLPDVARVDAAAFAPLWQISPGMLVEAFRQARTATVAAVEERVVGYQISTASPLGAHLARLAVDPSLQGTGVGRALVTDVILRLHRLGLPAITVNTQADNRPSLRLYTELGFVRTGQDLPLYRLESA